MIETAAEETNEGKPCKLAVWSLVLGIFSLGGLGFLTGIPAIVCGHKARKQLRENPELEGKGFATGGLVTGYLGSVLVTILILSVIVMIWTLIPKAV